MLNEKETIKISKFISLVLRHNPALIGLTLDVNGWAETGDLIKKMNENEFEITPSVLHHIVATNTKKRFSLGEGGKKIRANQGHSIEVELDLKKSMPPDYLYHGTGERSVSSILAAGLEKRKRHHVHLSADIETARLVGKRHGKARIFIVAAGEMSKEEFAFYLSDNNVWLTENVPVRYLKLIE